MQEQIQVNKTLKTSISKVETSQQKKDKANVLNSSPKH